MNNLEVTICGCGNGAHACAALLSSKGSKVNIYSPLDWEIKDFINNGNYDLEANLPSGKTISTRLNIITSDASKVIPNSSIVFIIVPAFAHENILRNIKEHISRECLIVVIPTRSGFEFQASDIIPNINIIGLQTLPWACRIHKFGSSVDIIGKKESLQAATIPQNISKVFLKQLEELLEIELILVKSMLTLTLGNVGQIIHPGIMYGIFKDNPNMEFKKEDIPLFYQSVDRDISYILKSISDEIQIISKKIYNLNDEIIDPKEVLPIDKWIINSYGDQIKDKSSLDKMFSTNKAYQGLKVPVKKIGENKYKPEFNMRYVTEDIPYGLLVVKVIADMIKVETPMIDIVIKSLGNWTGNDYLEDINLIEKCSKVTRIPIFHGIKTLDDLQRIYI